MVAVDTFFKMNRAMFGFEQGDKKPTKRRTPIVCLDPDDAAELYGYLRDKEEVENEETNLVTVI